VSVVGVVRIAAHALVCRGPRLGAALAYKAPLVVRAAGLVNFPMAPLAVNQASGLKAVRRPL